MVGWICGIFVAGFGVRFIVGCWLGTVGFTGDGCIFCGAIGVLTIAGGLICGCTIGVGIGKTGFFIIMCSGGFYGTINLGIPSGSAFVDGMVGCCVFGATSAVLT